MSLSAHARQQAGLWGTDPSGWAALAEPHNEALFEAVLDAAGVTGGTRLVDVGCGTGRALPALAAAVGPGGRVLGFDVTPAMLEAARDAGRNGCAGLVLADARRLPLPDGIAGLVFAAGLVQHLPDPEAGWWNWPG